MFDEGSGCCGLTGEEDMYAWMVYMCEKNLGYCKCININMGDWGHSKNWKGICVVCVCVGGGGVHG